MFLGKGSVYKPTPSKKKCNLFLLFTNMVKVVKVYNKLAQFATAGIHYAAQQRMNVNPTVKRVEKLPARGGSFPLHLLANFSTPFLANFLPPASIISVIHLYLNLSDYAFTKNI